MDPELDADAGYEAAMDALGARRDGRVPALDPRDASDARRRARPRSGVLGGRPKTTRQRIRAAERAGTTVRRDETGELPRRVRGAARRARRRAGHRDAPGAAATSPRGGGSSPPGRHACCVAEHEGQLAGGLLLYLQGGMHSTAYSADRAALRHALPGTMHLVRWTVIRDALAAGVTRHRAGRRGPAGTSRAPGAR